MNNLCSSLSYNLPACFVKDCFGSSENHTTIVNCKLDHKQNLHNGGNLGRSEKLYIVWYSTQLKWNIEVIHFLPHFYTKISFNCDMFVYEEFLKLLIKRSLIFDMLSKFFIFIFFWHLLLQSFCSFAIEQFNTFFANSTTQSLKVPNSP